MPWHHDFDAHFSGALHYCVKIFHFKPQEQAISIRLVVTIRDPAVVMLDFKAVQLENDLAAPDQLLVFPASVIAATAKKLLIPPAARFHICNSDQRLRLHSPSVSLCTLRIAQSDDDGSVVRRLFQRAGAFIDFATFEALRQ